MALTPMERLLAEAQLGRYAVCYSESWNLESFVAVKEAAEEARAPVIMGFNGGFLMHSSRAKADDLVYYAGLGLALRDAAVPVALLLNEADSFTQIEQGIAYGFTAVMVENDFLQPRSIELSLRK